MARTKSKILNCVELKTILDKATPLKRKLMALEGHGGIIYVHLKGHHRTIELTAEDNDLFCALRNNAPELLRLAEIGKEAERRLHNMTRPDPDWNPDKQ